jgi:hypothetical protein
MSKHALLVEERGEYSEKRVKKNEHIDQKQWK